MDDKAPENDVDETPPEGQRNANLYSHAFWDKGMQPHRRLLPQVLLLPVLYTTLLMWACLSLYWGSLLPNNDVTKIKVYFVDLDGDTLGNAISTGVQAAASSPNALDWQFDNTIRSPADSENIILSESAWAVVQISANASSSLAGALKSGNSSYSPLAAATLYYASARNQITVNSHVVPSILAVLNPLLSVASIKSTATFISTAEGNKSALQTAIRCPQCLASPFAMASIDLIPFNSATAQGSTMVGLIFLLTFTFSIFQILHATGLVIGGELKLSSALTFRTLASLTSYLIMALSYTLINFAFGVPMETRFGKSGFVIYWMLNTCTMGAVGLPMESLFTLIGLKWAGYFLSFWIIVNVAPAFTSFDLMPSFFKYGYAFPFFHSIQGARTIIFGTKDHLGLNFGVLIAWMVAGLVGMYAVTAWRTRTNKKSGVHALP